MDATMPASTFDTCLAFTWLPENDGQPYHVTPSDPGGITAWAVTQGIWRAWLSVHPAPWGVSVASATKDQLAEILHAWFYQPTGGDRLPAPLALMMFDFGVCGGPGTAVRLLQALVHVPADGILGPQTVGGLGDYRLSSLLDALHGRIANHLLTCDGYETFGAAG